MSVQIFSITDGITEKNAKKVFDVINNLKTQKESAFGVLYLIYANVEKMLRLKLAGARSVKTVTLLDKPSRREVEFEPDYCGATIPDEFVVGYGLDYAEKYRTLPYVAILKPEVYNN
jgi:hypothetical protein